MNIRPKTIVELYQTSSLQIKEMLIIAVGVRVNRLVDRTKKILKICNNNACGIQHTYTIVFHLTYTQTYTHKYEAHRVLVSGLDGPIINIPFIQPAYHFDGVIKILCM